MDYWLAYWWIFPIALLICILVCLVGVEGSILFAPFYAVFFPTMSGRPFSPLQAIQVGLISEIFGFTSSFIGFWRAKLIDYRLGLMSSAAGAPLALGGVLLAYALPQPVLLAIVAAVLPFLAWFLSYRGRGEPEDENVRDAARSIPLCCYVSDKLYADQHEQRDRAGRAYQYSYRGSPGRIAVSAAGGLSTGLVGFGVGVIGVSHLIMRRVPIRIAVGTSHLVILLVTGVAVAAHLVEMSARGQTPPWNVLVPNILAVLIGGQLAAWLAGRLPEQTMRRVLVALLIGVSIVTFYRAWRLGLKSVTSFLTAEGEASGVARHESQ
jgi:uncharacterized protein